MRSTKQIETGLSIRIHQLEKELAKIKDERDALSAELNEARAMVQDAKEHAELFMEGLTQVKRERMRRWMDSVGCL